MTTYNWQQKDWPSFRYTLDESEDALFAFAERVGHVAGILKGITREYANGNGS